MRMFLILAGLLLSLAAEPQDIYRWVDKNGVVHYADQPGDASAELVELAGPNSYESEPAAGGESSPAPSSSGGDGGGDEPLLYESLTIVQPQPEQVFFGADVTVAVEAELGGELRGDHQVVFFVDGNRRPASGLGIELSGLERGTHFVRAAVLDHIGNPLIASQQISFHIRQASINSPQSPQGRPNPPPRPTPRPAN